MLWGSMILGVTVSVAMETMHGRVQYWQTAKETSTDRLKAMPTLPLQCATTIGATPPSVEGLTDVELAVLHVDPSRSYQEILGFGGAFTQASAHVWQSLSTPVQAEIIGAYFDVELGLGYTTGRVFSSVETCLQCGSYHTIQ